MALPQNLNANAGPGEGRGSLTSAAVPSANVSVPVGSASGNETSDAIKS